MAQRPTSRGSGIRHRGRLLLLVLGATTVAIGVDLTGAQSPTRVRRDVTVNSAPVALSFADPTLDRAGVLVYKGGLALSSSDSGFGGFSGLRFEARTGALLAITDQGEKLAGKVVFKDGRPVRLESASLEPLRDPEGHPIQGKQLGDAESMARTSDGRMLVGFERRHRIWNYGPDLDGPAVPQEAPATLARLSTNGGLESLVAFRDGRLLALVEQRTPSSGDHAAYLRVQGTWSDLTWRPSGPGFDPSDAALLPDGDVIVLERAFMALPQPGLSSRLVRVKGADVRPGAVLEGEVLAELRSPLITENFEGVSVTEDASGSTLLALISDDNFNGIQRTLLLIFELPRRPDAPRAGRQAGQPLGEMRSAATS